MVVENDVIDVHCGVDEETGRKRLAMISEASHV